MAAGRLDASRPLQGQLRTRDMARVDEDGFFFDRRPQEGPHHPRRLGGYNVYPREIEEL